MPAFHLCNILKIQAIYNLHLRDSQCDCKPGVVVFCSQREVVCCHSVLVAKGLSREGQEQTTGTHAIFLSYSRKFSFFAHELCGRSDFCFVFDKLLFYLQFSHGEGGVFPPSSNQIRECICWGTVQFFSGFSLQFCKRFPLFEILTSDRCPLDLML